MSARGFTQRVSDAFAGTSDPDVVAEHLRDHGLDPETITADLERLAVDGLLPDGSAADRRSQAIGTRLLWGQRRIDAAAAGVQVDASYVIGALKNLVETGRPLTRLRAIQQLGRLIGMPMGGRR